MIASISGVLESVGTDSAVIRVGGIGFRVFLPTSVIGGLGATGTEVKLHTHLHVREDNLTLFGFATAQELFLFDTLLTVTGLGPRLALALLSALGAEQLSMAIVTCNTALLTITPGVGKKVAERIILELKEKIGASWVITSTNGEIPRESAEVLAALTSLGYSVAEAQKASSMVPANESLSLEDRIKLALAYFSTPS
ncbi:Holliday junction branch migration protein RuvA [Chloroflexota bacterium]